MCHVLTQRANLVIFIRYFYRAVCLLRRGRPILLLLCNNVHEGHVDTSCAGPAGVQAIQLTYMYVAVRVGILYSLQYSTRPTQLPWYTRVHGIL